MDKNNNTKRLISEIWSVSWPMAVIMFFIFLIGIADVYVAGRFGKEVQAAYGLVFQLYFIFSIIATALTVGSVSLLSRLFTSPRKDEFKLALDSSLIINTVAGALLGIFGVIFSGKIVGLLSIPGPLKGFAAPLLQIYSAGLIFNYILMGTNGILRSCGMVKKSLWTMAAVCLLNIVLNFYLSLNTSLGFQGIAVATAASAFLGSIINLLYIARLTRGPLTFSLLAVKRIFGISWPAGLLQVLWQMGAVLLFLIIGTLPKNSIETLAAFTNGLKIESAIFLPAFAFNMANAVIVGNLLGREEKEKAFHSGIVTATLGVVIVVFLTLAVMLNARQIASFLSNNDLVIGESVRYIYISLISEPLMAWGVILAGGLNGAGDTRSVMNFIALSIWLVRIPLSYFLGVHLGLGAASIWWSMNISILVQTVFISRRYFGRKWMAHGHANVI
jgi:multidrug resistance protein, MATE family